MDELLMCISSHVSEYPNFIQVSKGEKVTLGECAPEEHWNRWIWAETANGLGGWVPLVLIQTVTSEQELSFGILKEEYSSKELTVNKGDKVLKLRSLEGWSWVRRVESTEEGWIPNEKLAQIPQPAK